MSKPRFQFSYFYLHTPPPERESGKLEKKVAKTLLKYNSNSLHDVFLTFLSSLFKNEPIRELQTIINNPSAVLRRAFSKQTEIGWNNVLYRRWALDWNALAMWDLQISWISAKQMTADRWSVKLITIFYTYFLQLWQNRNQIQFGRPELSDFF